MAFSSPFSVSSTPAFGGTTSLFGGSSASPFVQQSTPSLFGSSPAFGAASTPLFGASSAPAFGGFGAASTPAFGGVGAGASAAAATPSLFGTPAAPAGGTSLFSAPAFGTAQSQPAFGSTLFGGAPQQQQQLSLFGLQPQQQQQQSQPQQQQPQLQSSSAALVTKDGKPLSHATKWEDISPEGQAYLLELEMTIMKTREQCRQLENCERLRQAAGRQAMEEVQHEIRAMRQSLQYLQMLVQADLEEVASFREKALHLMHDTEQAVFTYKRTQRWRDAAKAAPGAALPPNLREQLAGPIVLPSAYLRRAVASFQETVQQYKLLVSELEAVLPLTPLQLWADASGFAGNGSAVADPLRALPAAVQNLHDYLIHVAARLERLHEAVDRAKDVFLDAMRKSGDLHDPFAAAERREQQRRNAAKERVTSIPPAGSQQAAAGIAPATAAPGSAPAGPGWSLGGAAAVSPFNTASVPAAAGATGFARAASSAAPPTRKTKAKSGRA